MDLFKRGLIAGNERKFSKVYKLGNFIKSSNLRIVSMLPSDPQGLLDAYFLLCGEVFR